MVCNLDNLGSQISEGQICEDGLLYSSSADLMNTVILGIAIAMLLGIALTLYTLYLTIFHTSGLDFK